MRLTLICTCLPALILTAQFSAGAESTEPAAVDHERLLNAGSEPGNWMAWGRGYHEDRYSPLDQINDSNVNDLGLAWYYTFNNRRGNEATPIVIDGVLYTTSAWNITVALDAKTGQELWYYDPEVPPAWGKMACCDVVTRGLAAWNGKIIIATLDGRLIALNAKDGKPVWTTQTFSHDWPYTITGAPRVFDGKVIIGNAGGELGVRGYVTAYDAETGHQLWRFYTVPGNPEQGFESETMAMAANTWNGEWWKYGGGGTVWDAIVYDPDFNRIYIGVGNGSPWVQAYRSPGGGDNLFLSSIVALDADTGNYLWHYQEVPGEQWDYTASQHILLADLKINGRLRKVLMQAPKNGFFYLIDRETGKLISAEKFVPLTWARRVDLKTGRPVFNPKAFYDTEPVKLIPGPAGAHNWHPMSYSPETGLVYFPVQDVWFGYARDQKYDVNQPKQFRTTNGILFVFNRDSGSPQMDPAAEKGWLTAWDPVRQREAWRVNYPEPGAGGVLATAGNLVVQGTRDNRFIIYRADNGLKLWEMPVQNASIAGPIAYSVDGEQYIAVNAGWGGGMAMMELAASKRVQRSNSRLLVFKLGGTATLPPLAPLGSIPAPPPVPQVAPQVIDTGAELYGRHCASCHGIGVRGGGVIKDLRHMSGDAHAVFKAIVLQGARESLGMGSFSDVLTAADADAVHAYLILRANQDWELEHR
jgi:quinohemoprotein ethanol dehydrogenase